MNSDKATQPLFHKVFPSIKENAKTLFFIHGFADSGDEFLHLVPVLTQNFRVVLITLPGFGEAEPLGDVSAEALLPQFIKTFELFEGEKIVVGYSMGGRFALFVALHSEINNLRSLILVSSSTGIDNANERIKKLQEEDKLVQFIEKTSRDEFAEYWLSLPIFEGLKKLPSSEYSVIKARKAQQAKSVLIQYLQQAGQGNFPNMGMQIKDLRQKIHIVVGESDIKYCEIGKLLNQKLLNSELHVIPATGHAVHRENPKDFLDLLIKIIEID